MAKDDLFGDEGNMVRMTFGEHLEDLRRRLILSLLGFIPFVIIGLFLGDWLVEEMSRPAKRALTAYADVRRADKLKKLDEARELEKALIGATKKPELTRSELAERLAEFAEAREKGRLPRREQIQLRLSRESLRAAFRQAFPELDLPESSPEAKEHPDGHAKTAAPQIGRASCRERV